MSNLKSSFGQIHSRLVRRRILAPGESILRSVFIDPQNVVFSGCLLASSICLIVFVRFVLSGYLLRFSKLFLKRFWWLTKRNLWIGKSHDRPHAEAQRSRRKPRHTLSFRGFVFLCDLCVSSEHSERAWGRFSFCLSVVGVYLCQKNAINQSLSWV